MKFRLSYAGAINNEMLMMRETRETKVAVVFFWLNQRFINKL